MAARYFHDWREGFTRVGRNLIPALALVVALLGAPRAFALNGVVETLDGKTHEGEVQLGRGELTINTTSENPETVSVALSNLASAQFVKSAAVRARPGDGTGLVGIYYDAAAFTGRPHLRLDEAINFEWASGPMLGMPRDYFSVRWLGQVEAPATDDYTFYLGTDDGGRLWFEGKLVADSWTKQGFNETSATLRLNAGQRYNIKVEHSDHTGPARARFMWSASSFPKTLVPRDRLFPETLDPDHRLELEGKHGLLATYFNSDDFSGKTFSRIEPGPNAVWTGTSPVPGASTRRFAVRWTGQITVTNTGAYQLHISAGQPVRCYFNDRLVTDPWLQTSEQAVDVNMRIGERYDIRLETRVTNATGRLTFQWSHGDAEKSVVPAERFHPVHAVAGVTTRDDEPEMPAGVVLLDGTVVSAPIASATETTLRLRGLFSAQSVPLSRVARIHTRPLARELLATIPKGRTGVLLRNHDFVEADFGGIQGGRLKISSVLFGNRTFDLARDVVVIALRDADLSWEFNVTARDGSALYGPALKVTPERVGVAESLSFSVPAADVVSILRAQRTAGSTR